MSVKQTAPSGDSAMARHAASMVFPIGTPNDGFAQYFTGRSFLAPVSTEQVGIFNVTFEPGCRNNWHIHHAKSGGQILICVAGRGFYQEWGRAALRRAGGARRTAGFPTWQWRSRARRPPTNGWRPSATETTPRPRQAAGIAITADKSRQKASQSLPPAGGKASLIRFLRRRVRRKKHFSVCKPFVPKGPGPFGTKKSGPFPDLIFYVVCSAYPFTPSWRCRTGR